MPVYTYRREDGTTFDVRQKFTEEALTVDPQTGQRVVRVVQAAGIIFKGSGFYVNDSKSASKSSISTPGKAGETSSSDNKSGETTGTGSKAAESKSDEGKSAESKSGENKSSEKTSTNAKPSESKTPVAAAAD
jgi:putative FmdB family regulatory protein